MCAITSPARKGSLSSAEGKGVSTTGGGRPGDVVVSVAAQRDERLKTSATNRHPTYRVHPFIVPICKWYKSLLRRTDGINCPSVSIQSVGLSRACSPPLTFPLSVSLPSVYSLPFNTPETHRCTRTLAYADP